MSAERLDLIRKEGIERARHPDEARQISVFCGFFDLLRGFCHVERQLLGLRDQTPALVFGDVLEDLELVDHGFNIVGEGAIVKV